MNLPHKPDPGVYAALRRSALEMRVPRVGRHGVQVVLMDWHVEHGTATVLAAADGTASLYLSNGGGFMDGSERYPRIRSAALHAVSLANGLLSLFELTSTASLPSLGDVTFYVTTSDGVHVAVAAQKRLRSGTDPLAGLGGAMQRIVAEYRLNPARGAEGPDSLG